MKLDDRARAASEAVSERSRAIAPHRKGLQRKPWVRPAGVAGIAVLVVFVAFGLGIAASDHPDRVETGVAPKPNAVPVVGGVSGPISAAFVSVSGEISVLVGDDAGEVSLVQLRSSAAAPLLGVETIPEPRWLSDGRVIEYVAEIGDVLQLVRVDVRTGLTRSEPYWVVQTSDGTSTSLEDDGPLMGTIQLMSSANRVSVTAVEDETDSWWQLSRPGRDRTVLDLDSTRFLAPATDGLIVIADDVLAVIGEDGAAKELDVDGVTAEQVTVAAGGPASELAFGIAGGSVVVSTVDRTESFHLGDDVDEATGLSWGKVDEVFVVAQTDDETSMHHCSLGSSSCTTLESFGGQPGRLVRGTPVPRADGAVVGVWPETTQDAAAATGAADSTAPYRFDPELLVAEFATAVLGWSDPIVEPSGSGALPYITEFDLRPAPDQATVPVTAAQLDTDSGWVITKISSPNPRVTAGFGLEEPIAVGFDRQGAETVEVILRTDDAEYHQSTDDLDEVEFEIEVDLMDTAVSYLVLFKDAENRVFAANSGTLGRGSLGLLDVTIG